MILCVTKQTGQKNFVKIPNESYQEIVRDPAKYLIKNLRFSQQKGIFIEAKAVRTLPEEVVLASMEKAI